MFQIVSRITSIHIMQIILQTNPSVVRNDSAQCPESSYPKNYDTMKLKPNI